MRGGLGPDFKKLELPPVLEPLLAKAAAAAAGESGMIWVQCEAPGCGKWRRLPPTVVSAHLPPVFECSMAAWIHAMPSMRCDTPEDQESESEEEPTEQDERDVLKPQPLPVHVPAAVDSSRSAPPAAAKKRKRAAQLLTTLPTTGGGAGGGIPSTVGSRLEYLFGIDGSERWVGGSVTKLLSASPGWVAVRFDDGDAREV